MSDQPSPQVSVVVPVRDDREGLARCLQALARQTVPAHEVIVVDDGSREDPTAVCDRAGVRLLRQEPAGPYAARNRGIAAADGEVIALTDADCVPRPGWLEAGTAALVGTDAGMVGGRVAVLVRSTRPSGAELYQLLEAFPQRRYVEKRGFAVTANLFARRSVLEEVGGFHGDLRSGGDLDLGRRVRDAGYAIIYAEGAVVAHPARPSWRGLAAKQRRVLKGLREVGMSPSGMGAWVRLILPPARKLARAITDPRLNGPVQRLRYASVAVALHYLRLVEALRTSR